MSRKTYTGKAITVSYDRDLCLHVGECTHGLPAVFEVGRRPWILPDAGAPFDIAEVVERCPTGALRFEFTRPFREHETAGGPTTVVARGDGPLWLRGDIEITTDEGETHLTRAALCRCGQTGNAPFCDASGPCTAWREAPAA
jgi:uncharacterized Fe-S cluster protein YjdI/CDGSH-type Zn-finger protein